MLVAIAGTRDDYIQDERQVLRLAGLGASLSVSMPGSHRLVCAKPVLSL